MRLAIGLVVSMLIWYVAPAEAQPLEEQAKRAFNEGTKYYRAEKYTDASDAFRMAYALRPNWKLLYNIAQSEAAAKRYDLALESFENYLAEGGDDVAGDRRDEVLTEIRRLREIVGAVEVKAPDGALVLVDDLQRGAAPLPGPMLIVAGTTHVLRIELNGELLLEREVRLSGGQTITVDATVAEEPVEGLAPEAESAPETVNEETTPPQSSSTDTAPVASRHPMTTAGWALVAGGGAVLIAAIVTGAISLSISKDLEPRCTDQGCPDKDWDRNDTRRNLAYATDALIGVGAAVAATGAVLVVIGKKKSAKERAFRVSFTGSGIYGSF